ncbi:MAG: gamma carbonic anhydrase family protein [Spirulina sp. DLM2.Bin59]|nr:MAG: gamma carbonic anhydrase family protein [Spirulina sp. DLM2.Bin59]
MHDSVWPTPDLSLAAFVAANATVMGDVVLAEGVCVCSGGARGGYGARIVIGALCNIQDGAVLHGDPGEPTVLEEFVTVGHRAVIHSAHIEQGCLIGIGAIALNGVRVGAGSIIGAGCVVTKDVPPRSLMVGIPAKLIRSVDDTQAAELIEHAQRYEKLARVHAGTGTDLGFR